MLLPSRLCTRGGVPLLVVLTTRPRLLRGSPWSAGGAHRLFPIAGNGVGDDRAAAATRLVLVRKAHAAPGQGTVAFGSGRPPIHQRRGSASEGKPPGTASSSGGATGAVQAQAGRHPEASISPFPPCIRPEGAHPILLYMGNDWLPFPPSRLSGQWASPVPILAWRNVTSSPPTQAKPCHDTSPSYPWPSEKGATPTDG